MRERKILEANVLLGLTAVVCAYFVCEYLWTVAVGGTTSLPGLFFAVFACFGIATYHLVLALRSSRAGWSAVPWLPHLGRKSQWTLWTWAVPFALWLVDLSVRAYQWGVGAEIVRLPEYFVPAFAMLSATWTIETLFYRRWLRGLP